MEPHEAPIAKTSSSRGVPKAVQEKVLDRLEPEQRRYLDRGVEAFEFQFKGRYLYISARDKSDPFRAGSFSPLCRLGYTGDPDVWDFEIYLFSSSSYDVDQEFPASAQSPENCMAVAADFYLLGYSPWDAGSSREADGEDTTVVPDEDFHGEAALLPPVEGDDTPIVPDDFRAVAQGAGQVLLANMEAFLGFIAGRTFDLAPRTLGLRREELASVNALMARPESLSARPIQSDAPAVQCCFAAAEALGLLRVSTTRHRAEATERVTRFRALDETTRLWALLEVVWQRVRWMNLRPRSFGDMDAYQAGRYWLGAELGRRRVRLEFVRSFVTQAEILEVYLFRFWADAGLVNLTYSQNEAKRSRYSNRSSGLNRVDVTALGRIAFENLSKASPGREFLEETMDRLDGKWQGDRFLRQIKLAGLW